MDGPFRSLLPAPPNLRLGCSQLGVGACVRTRTKKKDRIRWLPFQPQPHLRPPLRWTPYFSKSRFSMRATSSVSSLQPSPPPLRLLLPALPCRSLPPLLLARPASAASPAAAAACEASAW